eukprot:gb/GEZN01011239.1/.p1 GENE.gb/GEZN01011239.1/~~gb/GEZN01011239.1/.p1  ORF type:complete len:231 (+),score=56.09 gb/GEZN01011239.1/:80-772(+)
MKRRNVEKKMSKIGSESLSDAIKAVLAYANEEKKRNFTETIELQIGLKNYDPTKAKPIRGTLRLTYIPKESFKVCIIGDQKHMDEAKAMGMEAMSENDLKKLNKNKKLVKKLAAQYGSFYASQSLIRKIPRLLGPGLNKAGKFPSVLLPTDDMISKVNDAKASVKFGIKNKKTLCMGMPIGNIEMAEDDIAQNVILAVNYLVALLPKNWQNIKKVFIKSTMGPSQCIYGF